MIAIVIFLFVLVFIVCSLCPLLVTDEMQEIVKLER